MRQTAEFRVINPAEEKVGTTGNKFTTQEVILAWSELGDDGQPHEQRLQASLYEESQQRLVALGIKQGDVREVELRFMTYQSRDGRVFNRVSAWIV